MTKSQASQPTTEQQHKELYDFINNLPMNDIIELLNIVFYQDDINMDGKLKDSDKFRKLFIDTLFKAINNKELEEDDNVIINNIKQALEGIHNNKLSYDDLNYDFSIKTEEQRNIGISQFDNLGLFLTRYNIIPLNNIYLDDLEEDLKMNTIIKVIENKIKYKHVVERIKEYYYKELSEYKDDKFIMGELAKKFNLNFRVHTMNDKANKEELQRKDNDGWIIKCKPSQTKFEVAKLGNHYFNYERLFIPRNLLKDNNKLIGYFMAIGEFNIDKLYNDNTIKQFARDSKAEGNNIKEDDYLISSLEFLSILRRRQLLGRFIDNGNNKRIDKLTYDNGNISDNGKLKFDVFITAFEEMTKEGLFIKYYKLFNN